MWCIGCKTKYESGNYCKNCGKELSEKPEDMFPIETIIFLHSNRETMRSEGEFLGLEGKALELFKYALCEVEIKISVNENGTYKVLDFKG